MTPSGHEEGRTDAAAGTAAAIVGMAAFGALLVGGAVGPPGILIGGLAGALVGYLARS